MRSAPLRSRVRPIPAGDVIEASRHPGPPRWSSIDCIVFASQTTRTSAAIGGVRSSAAQVLKWLA